MFGVRPDQVAVIGDQVFTDIGCARKGGALAILTKPINDKENLFITDDYEQWVQKVWDLVDTTIRFFRNKDSWLLEESLYFMLKDLDLADDLIFDLND